MNSLERNLTLLTESVCPLKLEVPPVFQRSMHLDELQHRLHTDNPPAVLFNLRPYDNFNFVHATYVERLRNYQELGLRTVIILYDSLVIKRASSPNIGRRETNEAVRKTRAWLESAGISANANEVFLESDLCDLYSDKILDRLTSIAQHPEISKVQRPSNDFATTLESLCELVYESVLQVDFVLTGTDPNDVWNKVRLDLLQNLPFYSDETNRLDPPCVLSFPDVLLNSENKTARTDDPDLSVHSSAKEIKGHISSATPRFIQQLFDLLIIPKEKSRAIEIDGSLYSSYETASRAGRSIEQLNSVAEKELVKYFDQLKKADL